MNLKLKDVLKNSPVITFLIIVINFLVFFTHNNVAYGSLNDSFSALLGSTFSHANLRHLLSNTVFCIIFCPFVEFSLGKIKFMLSYLICGTVAAWCFVSIYPESMVLGASGALFGMFAMYPSAFKSWLHRLLSVFVVGIFLYLELLRTLFDIGHVANEAHLIGAVTGLLLLICFKK